MLVAGFWSRIVATAADRSDLETETVISSSSVAVSESRGGVKSLHEIRLGREQRRATQRTRLIRHEPDIDAVSVERVAAERKKTELILRLELRQANRAVAGGSRDARSAIHGGESEDRERVEHGGRFRLGRDSAVGESEGLGGGGRWRERRVVAATTVEAAEEEADGDGDEESHEEDEDDDEDTGFKTVER